MLRWGFRTPESLCAHEQSNENKSSSPSTQVTVIQAASDFLAGDLHDDLGLFQEELCPLSSLCSFLTVNSCSMVVNWVHPTAEAFTIINLLTFHYYHIFLLGCPLGSLTQGLWKKQFSSRQWRARLLSSRAYFISLQFKSGVLCNFKPVDIPHGISLVLFAYGFLEVHLKNKQTNKTVSITLLPKFCERAPELFFSPPVGCPLWLEHQHVF